MQRRPCILLVATVLMVVMSVSIVSVHGARKGPSVFDGQAHMGCTSKPPYVFGLQNFLPVNQPKPVLIASTTNGKAYSVNVPNMGGNTSSMFYLLHVYGDPYSQGYAIGSMMKQQVTQFVDSAWTYIVKEVDTVLLPYLAPWAAELVSVLGLEGALEYTYLISKNFTTPDFYEEMQGISDASGLSFVKIRNMHMLPGMTKGACSMLGAWGAAVPSGGGLLQLRALDWDMNGPFRDFSAITVYHPTPNNASQGNAWINVGFLGFIGALSGLSEAQLGISEIGVSFPGTPNTWGPHSQTLIPIPGVPFIVMLRDILKYDYTLDDSINRMGNAKRAEDLIMGVGDGKLGFFRSFQYSPFVFNAFDDMNMQPYNQTWHPRIKNTVYHGMDWDCPSYNSVMATQITKYWGKITPAVGMQSISPVMQSGDNHLAFYDLTNMQFWVSFAAPHNSSGPLNAFDRQYTQFNCAALFNEPAPATNRA